MKKTFLIILSVVMAVLTANAQNSKDPAQHPRGDRHPAQMQRPGEGLQKPDPRHDGARRWMGKQKEERRTYIFGQMQLTEKEKTAFTPVYDSYQKASAESHNRMKTAIRQMNDSCTDAQYEKAFEIINNERSVQTKLDENLYKSMKKILPMRKIYLYFKADRNFNKLMMKNMPRPMKKDKK